jgi:preprotein translocase subunit Sec63
LIKSNLHRNNKMNPSSNVNYNQSQQQQQGSQQFQNQARNYYETLGVNQNASADEITRAYKRLSLRQHPDQYKGTQQADDVNANFQHVSEAYQVLSDPERRVC